MSATPTPSAAPAPQPAASLKDGILGLLNVYIDPAATARYVQLKWSWIYPFVVVSIISIVVQLQMNPFRSQLRMNVPNAPPPQPITPMSQVISACTSVLFLAGMVAFVALLVFAFGAIVDARVRFMHVFSLLLTIGMITALQQIATLIIVKVHAEDIHTLRDLTQQPLGLDLFIHAQGVLASVLAFFSIFQVWAIVMTVLSYSLLGKTSKIKAFFVTCPGWILGLLFYIGIGFMSDKFFQ